METGKHVKKRTQKQKTSLLILIYLITTLIIIFCNKKQFSTDNLLQSIINDDSKIGSTTEESETNTKSERIVMLENLQQENSDIVAWLEIPDSKINYPVLQGEDNEFYMTHNYRKEYSKEGSLFLDKDYDWSLPSTNLLIYGHNNRGTDEMFVDLINYKEESYYNTHKTIRLTTNSEDAEYEIISVFLSRVYYKSEKNVFRYYYFINAENENEFNEYVKNCKKSSLYDIEATAQYGDQLLTLSTCEFSQEDGRLVVVAKKTTFFD